jgi:hypothetical protein
VRAIQRMASMNRRLSRAVAPGTEALPGRRCSMRAYCSSVNSKRRNGAPPRWCGKPPIVRSLPHQGEMIVSTT